LRGAGIFQAKQKPFPLSAITRQAGRPAAFFAEFLSRQWFDWRSSSTTNPASNDLSRHVP